MIEKNVGGRNHDYFKVFSQFVSQHVLGEKHENALSH
jgi:hypothetical protein